MQFHGNRKIYSWRIYEPAMGLIKRWSDGSLKPIATWKQGAWNGSLSDSSNVASSLFVT